MIINNIIEKLSSSATSSINSASILAKDGVNSTIDNAFSSGNSCSNISDTIRSKLKSSGFTDEELSKIDSIISSIPNTSRLVDSIDYQDVLDKVTENESAKMNRTSIAYHTMEKNKQDQAVRDAYVVQDAKYTLKITEPKVVGVATNPKNLPDANYTVIEDYPNSYGFIDSVKNWFKVNKTKRTAELVMASGTNIKCDGEGNVTWHVKGSLKVVVDGDYTEVVLNNKDILVSGNYHEGISINRS